MSEQSAVRRYLFTISACLITTTIIYVAYDKFTGQSQAGTGLHRSNAIRRPRRRWRRGHAPRELSDDPTTVAIQHLTERIASRQPYGRYDNWLLFTPTAEAIEQGRYDLLPQNLGPMQRELATVGSFTEFEKDVLNHHIQSIFVQNFLLEEFPVGYMIGDDVESLVHTLRGYSIDEFAVRNMVSRFDTGKPLTPVNWDLHEEVRTVDEQPQADSPTENVTPRDAIQALGGPVDEDANGRAWEDDESDPGGSQGMLDLLYHIAGEQAKRDGLVHRSVVCNSCHATPIRGIRYHCANCFNFDLCETCEAQQVHHKNHVFYKIRVPAPSRGHIKQVAPVWYPGNPNAFPTSLPKELSKYLMEMNKLEKTELDSLYEQYKCLAGHHLPREADPTRLGVAINRKNFDTYFTPTSENRPPPQNLLYDRIFAFYDSNNDDLITFDEFVQGMMNLQNRTRAAKVKRMFQGYDLDGDGYVSRRDFLKMFRAYYALHKELHRELIMNQDELDDDIRDAVEGSQPISAAFGWNEFAAHVSREGQDKRTGANGDLDIVTGPDGVLRNDSDLRGDRARSIATAAVHGRTRAHVSRSFREEPEADEPVMQPRFDERFVGTIITHADDASDENFAPSTTGNHVYGWPPVFPPLQDDIVNAIGVNMPLEEIMDPTDRARVIYNQAQRMDNESDAHLNEMRSSAIHQRWRRRRFYLDEEEGMTKPPGYTEPDSSDDENPHVEEIDEDQSLQEVTVSSSRRQSMRSRSSSKVRFDDSAIDTDYETRSNASSRSIPLNERWGGFELSEPEKDVGREILYQAVQQSFNELLDPLFKDKEDKALVAISTKATRRKWRRVIDEHKPTVMSLDEKVAQFEAKWDGETVRSPTPSLSEVSVSDLSDAISREAHEPTALLVNHNKDDDLDGISELTERDPTLPQNRPNDRETTQLLLTTATSASPTTTRPRSTTSSSSIPSVLQNPEESEPDLSHKPPVNVIRTWIQHNEIDAEAEERGGYGRLSFDDFKKKMVSESINEVIKFRGDQQEGEELNEDEIWGSTADLGKLSFLGTWLEVMHF